MSEDQTRRELIEAAMRGINEHMASTRGAAALGAGASCVLTKNGFTVISGDGAAQFHFETTVM